MINFSPELGFIVPGIPQQQGSKRHVGKGIMIDANKNLMPWRESVIWHARQAMREDFESIRTEVQVAATFVFPRPKSHYGNGRNVHWVKESAPFYKKSAPDLDKLQRALGDALTQAGVIHDDALIVQWANPNKRYGPRPETRVVVYSLNSKESDA